MEDLFYVMLCKKARRRQIMFLWHLHQPVGGDTLSEVVYNIIKQVLYGELCIILDREKLRIFAEEEGFAIPYTAMTEYERQLIGEVYQQRHTRFRKVQHYQDGRWVVRGYLKRKEEKEKELWPQRYRREMVRDFVFFALSRPWPHQKKSAGWLRRCLTCALILATQRLIACDKKRGDEFLRNFHNKLQGIGNINELMVMYD